MPHRKPLKKQNRAEVLARRDELPLDWRIDMSLKIAETGVRKLEIHPGEIVSGFMPMRSEVDVRPLMAALAEKGARICVPAILDKTTIVFRELVRGAPLVDMGFGTVGPGPEAPVLEPSLMLMPLAAFDGRGHRIGYGAGYYDRAIDRLHAKGLKPQLIAIAWDCQEIPLVPNEDHDVMLDGIITESGLRRFAKCT
jgi:5-formyltetrahydrofolate cyclo-ligase